MKLYLDAGNSRIKWLFETQKVAIIADSIQILRTQWLGASLDVTEIVACSVANEQTKRDIDELARQIFECSVLWQQTSDAACGIKNAYSKSQNLGVDRWLALIAARALYPKSDCIVVDAGTAITVDLLDKNGNHRGGVIMAGKPLLMNAIDRAERLTKTDPMVSNIPNPLGKSTEDAISAGVFYSINGGIRAVIEEQVKKINARIEAIPIVLTGGDAEMIILDKVESKITPNLVLDGLRIVGECK